MAGGVLARGLRSLADKLRAIASPLSAAELKKQNTPRKRLVILGTGWSGLVLLRKVDRRRMFDVRVVSPRNHFLFTPLLASTAVGTLEFRSVVQAVRATGFRDEHDFNLAHVTAIDTKERVLRCVPATDNDEGVWSDRTFSVRYDTLAVAVGARVATYGVPGVEQHAMYLKQVADARAVRRRIIDNFETAVQETVNEAKRSELLHFVVVGGGPTGVEFCGELHDFLRQDAVRYFPSLSKHVRVTLVEARDVLGAFDVSLRQFALRKLADRPYMDIQHLSVIEVMKHSVVLSDGSEVPCGLCVWTAGVRPVPLVESLPWEKTKAGRIKVDEYLRVVGQDHIYALGDCADIDGTPMPATAQVAEAQASYLAKHLPALEAMSDDDDARVVAQHNNMRGDEQEVRAEEKEKAKPPPFAYVHRGMMAYIGEYAALAELKDDALSGKSAKLSGFGSWVLWRSAYWSKQGSMRLWIQVPLDWFKTFFFGRDMSKI